MRRRRARRGAALASRSSTRPAKNFLTYSLQRLGVDHIDIYRPARLDPAVPIEADDLSELIERKYAIAAPA